MKINVLCKTVSADLTTPLAVYARLRDRYPHTLLFESSDFHGPEDCRSFICCDPIAEFILEGNEYRVSYLGVSSQPKPLAKAIGFSPALSEFLNSFEIQQGALPKGIVNGAFGHICWDAIEYMENIELQRPLDPAFTIPKVRFMVFRYVMAFNHFRNEVHVLHNVVDGEQEAGAYDTFFRNAFESSFCTYPFRLKGGEESLVSDAEFLELIATCKKHIARGDVFEIVPSRRFFQRFEGDDFQLYRALRSINPSPYLFYGDFGGYTLIGSSPEAQIIIRDGRATIFPIAGTYERTGDDERDRTRAKQLLEDPKENAEHCMLVDLARNDLSRHCKEVKVAKYRETRLFSHVIHLVSEVVGQIAGSSESCQIVADTFPAGTLSGAPKHRAMQILDRNEPARRGHYGGCIGMMGFDGGVVLGIMIRSFLSVADTLVYQAGMGVVYDSVPESELREVHAKLGALRAALKKAQEI
jgi:anthranilate synthase component 1